MGKPFSEMTETERRVNRALLRAGLSADWREPTGSETMNYDKSGIRLAMDQAAQSATRAVMEFRDARAKVGAALPALALDSAASAPEVYKLALDRLGVDTKGVPAAAYGAMFEICRKSTRPLTLDHAGEQRFAERFPNVARIRNT